MRLSHALNMIAAVVLAVATIARLCPPALAVQSGPDVVVRGGDYFIDDSHSACRSDAFAGIQNHCFLMSAACFNYMSVGEPYSYSKMPLEDAARIVPEVLEFADSAGFFDLAAQARSNAIVMSKQPIGDLGGDGVDSLLRAAHYLEKNNRLSEAETMYRNLLGSVYNWGIAPSFCSAVMLAYANFLNEHGRKNEAAPIFKELSARCADFGKGNCYGITGPYLKEWPYLRNSVGDYSQTHVWAVSTAHAPQYAKQNKYAEARSLLLELITFTDRFEDLNTHLYLFAELALLPNVHLNGANYDWNNLENILLQGSQDACICPQGLSLSQEETYRASAREKYLKSNLSALANLYSLNGEPIKALAILRTMMKNHRFSANERDVAQANVAFMQAQMGQFEAAKETLAMARKIQDRNVDFYLPFVRVIAACVFAGKSAIAEQLANSKIIRDNFAATESFYLQLATIENCEQHYESAEKYLYRIIDSENCSPQLRTPAIVALGQSLLGQRKYDECLKVTLRFYQQYDVREKLTIDNVIEALRHKSSCDHTTIIAVLRQAQVISMGNDGIGESSMFEQLEKISKMQKWNGLEAGNLKELIALKYPPAKRFTDSAKATAPAIGVSADLVNVSSEAIQQSAYRKMSLGDTAEAVDTVMKSLRSSDLDLQSDRTGDIKLQRLQIPQLTEQRQFDAVEKILKKCIELEPHGRVSFEKAYLARFYVEHKRFAESQLLVDEFLAGVIAGPDYFIFYSDDSEPPAALQVLINLGHDLIKAGRPLDAKELGLKILSAQSSWLGSKNPQLSQTYDLIVQSCNLLSDSVGEKKYLAIAQTINLGNSFLTDARKLDLFAHSYIQKGESRPAKDALLAELNIYETVEGNCNLHLSLCMSELACVALIDKDRSKASRWFQQASRLDLYPTAFAPAAKLNAYYAVLAFKTGDKLKAKLQALQYFENEEKYSYEFSGTERQDCAAACINVLKAVNETESALKFADAEGKRWRHNTGHARTSSPEIEEHSLLSAVQIP